MEVVPVVSARHERGRQRERVKDEGRLESDQHHKERQELKLACKDKRYNAPVVVAK